MLSESDVRSVVRHRSDVVAAVVLNWNGWRDTIECLASLFQSDLCPKHVVVCDNGSVDDSVEQILAWAAAQSIECAHFAAPAQAFDARNCSAKLVLIETGENRGFAAGNNVGIRYALERCRVEYVWMLNNDAVAEPSALTRMLETAKSDAAIAMVGCKLVSYEAPHTIQALGGGYILPVICHDTQLCRGKTTTGLGDSPIQMDHLIGASLLVRALAVRDVGLMDESYFLYREETDWCIRMRQAGWKLYCAPQATVWHKQSRSVGFKSPLHDYYAVRNILRLVRKFYPMSLPSALAYYACRSVLPKIFRMEFVRLQAVWRALFDFVRGVDGRPAHHTETLLRYQYAAASADVTSTFRHSLHKRRAVSVSAVVCAILVAVMLVKIPHHARLRAVAAAGLHFGGRRLVRRAKDDSRVAKIKASDLVAKSSSPSSLSEK